MKLTDRKDFRKTFAKNNMTYVKNGRKQQQVYIYKYSDDEYKVVGLKSVRDKGNERTLAEDDEHAWEKMLDEAAAMFEPAQDVSCETYKKSAESISRTKRVIYEYARCNKWDYFVTLTLDESKIDRNSIKEFQERFKKTIVSMNSQITGEEWGRQKKVEYLLVPEHHKNGGFHFHGFMRGFHKSDIRMNEHNHIEWKQYRDNFGFCNLQKIKNPQAVAKYATKYITKEAMETITEKGANAYYHSQGLKRAEKIYAGGGMWMGEWDYIREDGFCSVATVTRQQLHDNFVGEWGECIE